MNSDIILRDNTKLTTAIYDALFALLQKAAGPVELTKREPVPVKKEGAFEVLNFGMLRFKTSKDVSTYALGSSDANFSKIWSDLFPATDSGGPEAKPLEFEVMKHMFMALEPAIKAQGLTIDARTALIQEGASLGRWKAISVHESILFPIGSPKGELLMELPIFSTEYVKNLTLELYGFKESARMLVVDDSMVARKAARSCLAMAGYFNVEEVQDGQAALSKVTLSRPAFDLVVADWHMPVMSGLELLKKIRAMDESKKLPVIMVTGEKNKEEVVNAIREGVTAYLVKPVLPENFFKALVKAGPRG